MRRHCCKTAGPLRLVRKRGAAAAFLPAPALCPRVLVRPRKDSGASSGAPDSSAAPAAPVVAMDAPPLPPVAESVLALGHFAVQAWGGGHGFPDDLPANGSCIGGAARKRLGERARPERSRFPRRSATVADTAGYPDTLFGSGQLLLFSLHNYRTVAVLSLEKLSLVAVGVVVDTGAGPNLVRRRALAPVWLRQVVTSNEDEQVRLRDANNARLRTSGTVTLWLQKGARIVPVTCLVVEDLSGLVILGVRFIDDIAHAILPQDRSIRWTDGSVTAILRKQLDDGDR